MSLLINSFNTNQIYQLNSVKTDKVSGGMTSPVKNSAPQKVPTFGSSTAAQIQVPTTVRTELTTKEEVGKYNALLSVLDKNGRKNLQQILKNGRLLDANSNDKSTTLDNLYKIAANKRADGLSASNILNETLATIANPFIITQQFGDIPAPFVKQVVSEGLKSKPANPQPIQPGQNPDIINEQTVNVEHSGCCVAASIEFNLAKQMPAEFARFAEGLSSPEIAVKKTIETKNLSDKTLDAVWLLNAFKVPYKMNDYEKADLSLAPDKNAILRAQIQNSYKDPNERSLVDVLMQSTFMNVGSQQTYDSLTDVRQGQFTQNDRGLIEFEKTFVESIVEDKNKTSITYQKVDDDGKLVGYETTPQAMKKHIIDSLAMGENVIVGYTETDDTKTIVNGHEITILGAKQGKDGKLTFICNDTDDNKPVPIEYPEDYLLPKIHHAGLPQKVLENDNQFQDSWKDGIQAYKDAKQAENQPQQVQQPQKIA